MPGDDVTRIGWWQRGVEASLAARRRGVDVRAVTAWSLLGSFDWDTLCTMSRETVAYGYGPFDVTTGTPRETGLAPVIRETTRQLAS